MFHQEQRLSPSPEPRGSRARWASRDLWLRSTFCAACNYGAAPVGQDSAACFALEVFSHSNFTLKCLLKEEKKPWAGIDTIHPNDHRIIAIAKPWTVNEKAAFPHLLPAVLTQCWGKGMSPGAQGSPRKLSVSCSGWLTAGQEWRLPKLCGPGSSTEGG